MFGDILYRLMLSKSQTFFARIIAEDLFYDIFFVTLSQVVYLWNNLVCPATGPILMQEPVAGQNSRTPAIGTSTRTVAIKLDKEL